MCILSTNKCEFYIIIQVKKRKVNMADVNKGFPAILKKIKLTFIRVELRLEGPVSCIEIANEC